MSIFITLHYLKKIKSRTIKLKTFLKFFISNIMDSEFKVTHSQTENKITTLDSLNVFEIYKEYDYEY